MNSWTSAIEEDFRVAVADRAATGRVVVNGAVHGPEAGVDVGGHRQPADDGGDVGGVDVEDVQAVLDDVADAAVRVGVSCPGR